MKFNLFFVLLFTVQQINAQDFTESPYQDFSIASPYVADFDGDEKVDVLGIQYFSNPNRLVLQVNNGTTPIGFTEKNLNLNIDAVGEPDAADFDGDTDLDIVIAQGSNLEIYILHNDGFANFTLDSLGVSGSDELKIADIDNDTDLDIVGINTTTNKLNLYLNDGSQHFTTMNVLSGSDDLVTFDLGDMDNDGDVDIVLGFFQFNGKQIVLYKNNGSNNYEAINVAFNVFSNLENLLIDDINSDGKNDIIAIKSFSCDGFINQGNNSFLQDNLVSSGGLLRSVSTGDINGDGKTDIVLGKNSTDITWHKNLSNATLEFEMHTVGGVTTCFAIANADIDGDGDEDLIVTNGEFWWYENNVVQEPVSTLNFSENAISVLPNPFTEGIQINNPGQDTYDIYVVDNNGKNVYSSRLATGLIDLSNLKSGVYFLSVWNSTTQQMRSASIVKGQ